MFSFSATSRLFLCHNRGITCSRSIRETVLSVIAEYSGEAVDNCIHHPDPDRLVVEPEIAPHLLDKSTPDGSCLFNALSKELTGTERNHYALRSALLHFMLILSMNLILVPTLVHQSRNTLLGKTCGAQPHGVQMSRYLHYAPCYNVLYMCGVI